MYSQSVIRAALTALLTNVLIPAQTAAQQKIQPVCNPTLSVPIVVESSRARLAAGAKALPTLTDGFDWPDGPLYTLKTDTGYMFFSIDAGTHNRQVWKGHHVGNNNSGSVVRTEGTLDDPLALLRRLTSSLIPIPI